MPLAVRGRSPTGRPERSRAASSFIRRPQRRGRHYAPGRSGRVRPLRLAASGARLTDAARSIGAFGRLSEPSHDFVVDVVRIVDLQVVHPVLR